MSAVVALYRESKFGDCLVNSLDEMVHAGKIPPPLALRVLEEVRLCVVTIHNIPINLLLWHTV